MKQYWIVGVLLFVSAFGQQVPEPGRAKTETNPLATAAHSSNNLPSATWTSDFGFEDELYPSFVLTMGGRIIKNPDVAHFFGDPLGLGRVTIHPTVPNSTVHIDIQVEGLTVVSSLDATLAGAGQEYVLAPVLRWNYSQLQAACMARKWPRQSKRTSPIFL